MKNIYFIRHGESVNNAAKIRQGAEGDLTPFGRRQAEATARRLAEDGIKFDSFISSTMPRASQTAAIIENEIGISPEHSDLFIERRNPSHIIGLPHDHPEIAKVTKQVKENYKDPDWKYSDEESIGEFKERAKSALGHLEGVEGKNILVVTHAKFLRMFAAYVFHGDELTPGQFWKIFLTMRNHNAGINVFDYKEGRWRLVSWNDNSHLPLE